MKPVDRIFIIYNFVIAVLILLRFQQIPYWFVYIFIHLLLISIPILYLRTDTTSKSRKVTHFFRHWYPYLFFGLFYEEIGLINTSYFSTFVDEFFVQWDYMIFGFHPSLEFMYALPGKIFSEYMYFAYFSYFVLIPIVGMVFWVKKEYENFYSITFAMSLVYYLFFIVFVFLPVSGPRFYFPGVMDIDFKGYFFAPIMQVIMANVEISGGAFPSSHCAIACLAALYAFRVRKYFGLIITISAASLWTATVYGRFHYAVDVIYGVGFAMLIYVF